MKLILTGGPGAGKTTLLTAMAAAGRITIPEAARDVIRQHGRPANIQELIYNEALARFNTAPEDAVLDRSHVDTFAYGYKAEGYLDRLDAEVWVLLSDPSRYKNDAERNETYEESVRIGERLYEVYAQRSNNVKYLSLATALTLI